MDLVEELKKEIWFFGARPTLDSIEKIRYHKLRETYRRAFERAMTELIATEYRFIGGSFPAFPRPKMEFISEIEAFKRSFNNLKELEDDNDAQ